MSPTISNNWSSILASFLYSSSFWGNSEYGTEENIFEWIHFLDQAKKVLIKPEHKTIVFEILANLKLIINDYEGALKNANEALESASKPEGESWIEKRKKYLLRAPNDFPEAPEGFEDIGTTESIIKLITMINNRQKPLPITQQRRQEITQRKKALHDFLENNGRSVTSLEREQICKEISQGIYDESKYIYRGSRYQRSSTPALPPPEILTIPPLTKLAPPTYVEIKESDGPYYVHSAR